MTPETVRGWEAEPIADGSGREAVLHALDLARQSCGPVALKWRDVRERPSLLQHAKARLRPNA